MMLYELDDIEKSALMGSVVGRARADLNDGEPLTEMKADEKGKSAAGRRFRANLRKEAQAINEQNRVPGDPYYKEKSPRPGERIQKFWCEGCKEWHEGSVLGGPVGDTHERHG